MRQTYHWDSIIDKIWSETSNYIGHHDDITAGFSKCTDKGFKHFDEWKSNYEMIQEMKAKVKGVVETVTAINGAEFTNDVENNEAKSIVPDTPMFYINDTGSKARTDKCAPFTIVISTCKCNQCDYSLLAQI